MFPYPAYGNQSGNCDQNYNGPWNYGFPFNQAQQPPSSSQQQQAPNMIASNNPFGTDLNNIAPISSASGSGQSMSDQLKCEPGNVDSSGTSQTNIDLVQKVSKIIGENSALQTALAQIHSTTVPVTASHTVSTPEIQQKQSVDSNLEQSVVEAVLKTPGKSEILTKNNIQNLNASQQLLPEDVR